MVYEILHPTKPLPEEGEEVEVSGYIVKDDIAEDDYIYGNMPEFSGVLKMTGGNIILIVNGEQVAWYIPS